MKWLVLMMALPLAAAENDSFLLRNVTVHPVAGAEVKGGSVLVKDGRIAEVGVKVAAPKGVRVVDGKGLHVWPGFMLAGSTLGLSEVGSVRETSDVSELGDFNPQLRALIAVNPSSEFIPTTRANGITAALTVPAGGVISGMASLMHLDGWTWEEMGINRAAALVVRWPRISTRGGFSLEEGVRGRTPFAEARRRTELQVRGLHEFFEQARAYQAARAAGVGKQDLKFEAMKGVLEGKVPVLVLASREREIKEAIAFADKQKVKLILGGVDRPGATVADLKAKGIPVILGPVSDVPAEEDDAYDMVLTLPAELHKAGVKFAFLSASNQFARNVPFEAGYAVANGLPYDEAIKALTIHAAEMFGVEKDYGTIEKGKWADLIVTEGDPIDIRSGVKMMFVKGRAVSLESKHTRLYEQYLRRP